MHNNPQAIQRYQEQQPPRTVRVLAAGGMTNMQDASAGDLHRPRAIT
jgi:hypothetical protein